MDKPALLLLAWLASPVLSQAAECPLQGTWRSDAARTLADIAANSAVPAHALNSYSDDIFGHEIHEWSCTETRFWFDYQPRPKPTAYQVVPESADSYLVTVLGEESLEIRLEFEGDCYKILSASQKYYEYYCPVELP
jgi:hypothetical protein